MQVGTAERRIRRRMGIRPATPPAEPALTADLAARVAAAARVEVDSPGCYAAHLVTVDGRPVVVRVDADLTVPGRLAAAR